MHILQQNRNHMHILATIDGPVVTSTIGGVVALSPAIAVLRLLSPASVWSRTSPRYVSETQQDIIITKKR
jgi:hypothetical protein